MAEEQQSDFERFKIEADHIESELINLCQKVRGTGYEIRVRPLHYKWRDDTDADNIEIYARKKEAV